MGLLTDRKIMRTVGELRRALEKLPDTLPLAVVDYSLGYGIQEPYVSNSKITTYDNTLYPPKGDSVQGAPIDMDVCVIAPGINPRRKALSA